MHAADTFVCPSDKGMLAEARADELLPTGLPRAVELVLDRPAPLLGDPSRKACEDMGGALEPSGSCLVERLTSGRRPQCLAECSARTATDEYGACYAFQRDATQGTVLERYRMTSACLEQYAAFAERCGGMCAGADAWGAGGRGSYVAPLVPTQNCENNRTDRQCRRAGCDWHEPAQKLPLARGSRGDQLECLAAGGGVFGDVCLLPACTPFIEGI